MKRWLKIFLFCLTSLTLISWDRATKDLAKEHLMNKEPVSYLDGVVTLEYVENTGAAMGLGDDLPKTVSFWLLSILPLIFLSALFVYAIKKTKELSFAKLFPFALIIAGGIGNIIDRLMYNRHVTDFIHIGFNNLRTGIFNFADVCVTSGAIALLVFYRSRKAGPPTDSEKHLTI